MAEDDAKRPRKTARKSRRRERPVRRAKIRDKKASPRRWSQRVTEQSDALDLQHGVFS